MDLVEEIEGLTHPPRDERWFGSRLGSFFFRLCDGDRYVAVLPDRDSPLLVDVIPFRGDGRDPRRDIHVIAVRWTHERRNT
jgi:hypothetical protein